MNSTMSFKLGSKRVSSRILSTETVALSKIILFIERSISFDEMRFIFKRKFSAGTSMFSFRHRDKQSAIFEVPFTCF